MLYYVMKSGLPMFDACRAYGLGMVIEQLSAVAEADEDVLLTDVGHMYVISGPDVNSLTNTVPHGLFDNLLVVERGWEKMLLTFKGSPLRTKKMATVQRILSRVEQLLTFHAEPRMVQFTTSREKGETIPSVLEIAATQGLRGHSSTSYIEKPLCVNELHWVPGMLGGAHLIRWSNWGANKNDRSKQIIALLPSPKKITFVSHREIRAMADVGYPCRISTQTVAAHYAVMWILSSARFQASQSRYSDTYGVLIVQALSKTGEGSSSTWKVQKGDLFPFSYLARLLEDDVHLASQLLNEWSRVFRWGSVKGYERLALTLAEFLEYPGIEMLEDHIKVLLRVTVIDEGRRPFPPYHEEWMQEVLKHVR